MRDMGCWLFPPENFCKTPVETLCCYQQCHDNLMAHDLTTGCWATATPKAELIIIQERFNNIVQHPIGDIRDGAYVTRTGAHSVCVVTHYLAHRARVLEGTLYKYQMSS